MSTKAIRDLLADYLDVCAARASEFGAREPHDDERKMYRAALVEVEAIEKAAGDVLNEEMQSADSAIAAKGMARYSAACDLFASIAKGAT